MGQAWPNHSWHSPPAKWIESILWARWKQAPSTNLPVLRMLKGKLVPLENPDTRNAQIACLSPQTAWSKRVPKRAYGLIITSIVFFILPGQFVKPLQHPTHQIAGHEHLEQVVPAGLSIYLPCLVLCWNGNLLSTRNMLLGQTPSKRTRSLLPHHCCCKTSSTHQG